MTSSMLYIQVTVPRVGSPLLLISGRRGVGDTGRALLFILGSRRVVVTSQGEKFSIEIHGEIGDIEVARSETRRMKYDEMRFFRLR